MIEELNNKSRAGWAREAVEAYARETRHSPSEQVIDVTTRPDEWPGRDHAEEVISDLLGDLRHLCDELGLDFDEQSERGAMHHREEVAEEKHADELLAAEEAGEVKCRVCSEPIHRAAISQIWIHGHGSPACGTGDGATAAPVETTTVDEIMALLEPTWGDGK